MKKTPLLLLLGLLVFGGAAAAAESADRDDPETIKLLAELDDNAAVYLPPFKTEGPGMELVAGFDKRGPKVRDYGNKLVYAPARRSAMYCGANHAAPSRLNDVSEYRLGANTWRLLSPPAGGDHGRVGRAQGAIKGGKEVEKNSAFLKEWFGANCELRDGYLQTKPNGGPVCPWHTWDGLAFDVQSGKLLWAVLDTDPILDNYLRAYAEHTGRNFEELQQDRKPGTGLYLFDPATMRWTRQMGPEPRPYLRGMGGSLTYIPDIKRTIWYCAAQNVIPNDFAMWSYDATSNVWSDLKPNDGKSIRNLVHVDKVAPGSEVQMAYSERHKKIVAVLGKHTFVYDVPSNSWSKVSEDEGNRAHDASTVFAYDSVADLFLLLNAPKGQWDMERELRAFDLKTGKWETLVPQGEMFKRQPYCGHAGYYDPEHNVFVVYGSTPRVWVYRSKRVAR